MSLPKADVPKDFATRLKTVLRVLGISQTEFARRLEVSDQAVCSWCRNTTPSRLYLKEIDGFVSKASVQAGKYLRGETTKIPPLMVSP